MQRKMKLIQKLLTHVECHAPEDGNYLPIPEIEGYTDVEVHYHVRLCEEAGYIKALPIGQNKRHSGIWGLTWAGHDKLDELRSGQSVA